MIVIEGMDNSGKSTLGEYLAGYLDYVVQESEGPPLSEEEINQRIERYATMTQRVFVRHPVTSNAIYGQVREEGDLVSPANRMAFYEQSNIIIYCDAGQRGLEAHIQKAHDTDKHLKDITEGYDKLLRLYREWAAQSADFIYRIGDDMDLICYLVNITIGWKEAIGDDDED